MFPHLNPDLTGFILSNQRKRRRQWVWEQEQKWEERGTVGFSL